MPGELFTFLSLGDSYTVGTGVTAAESWPFQLVDLLRGRGVDVADPVVIAKNGWTSADLLKGMDEADLDDRYDFVTLMIGVNDQYDGVPLQEYERNFDELLARSISLTGGDPASLIVISIPDWSVTPFAKDRDRTHILAQLARFNTVNRREARRLGCSYIDITPNSWRAGHDLSLLASDQLHPSGKMYADWAEMLLSIVVEILFAQKTFLVGECLMEFTPDASFAQELDVQDNLAAFRDRFVIDDPDLIYLDGNSLGRLPKATPSQLQEAVEHQWGQRLIRSWNEHWIQKPSEIGAKIAELIGAHPDEILVTDSTSANLFKLTVAGLRARPGREKIVTDELNFPSDLYIFQGVIDLLDQGHQIERVASPDDISIPLESIRPAIDENTALVALTHVAFKSAFMYDMQAMTQLAHQYGALALWDLSHSVGAVPLKLNEWDVDMAVGCTYKYLNGGPGSPAFLYVRRDLQDSLMQPIWGWFATKSPFEFNLDFSPAEGMARFQVGTPPMLSMLGIEPAVDILLEAGMDRLREKSVCQTEYLIELARAWLLPLGFEIGSPLDSARRGSHVSLRHPEAYRINRAMIEAEPPAVRVIPDFRTPDNIRLGIAPIYTSYTDIYRGLKRMRDIVEQKIYEQYSKERLAVT